MTTRSDDDDAKLGQGDPAGTAGLGANGLGAGIAWERADQLLVAGLVVVGCVLLVPNLGDRCLWQDEAECALVARGILRTGLPVAWDGRLFATGAFGVEVTDSFLWAWTPWAMHYLAAAGMAVFGQTSLGARLPFALLGCASIGLTYWVARRLIGDRWASGLAAVLLITSVQYLLLMRQCRYYAIVPVAALLAIWGYTELSRRRGIVLLSAGLVLLFYANYLTCACVAFGLVGHAVLWRRDRQTLTRLGLSSVIAGGVTLPWFFGLGLHHTLSASQAAGYHKESAGHGAFKLLFVMNQFVCPFVVVAGLVITAARGRLRVRGAYGLVACMAVPVMILVPAFLWAGPRYLVHMLPLGAIVVAAALREVYLRSDVLGNIGAIAVGVTNLLPAMACAVFPASIGAEQLDGDYATGPATLRQGMLKSEWAGYIHELREPFVGPNEAITRALSNHGEPNDVVYAPYGQLPIMFHTNRRCAGLLKPESRNRPGWDRLPEYLWDTDVANVLIVRPAMRPSEGYNVVLQRWRERARRTGRRLVAHNLKVKDIGWGNRPLLRYHYFQSPGAGLTDNITLIRLVPSDRAAPPMKPAPQVGPRRTEKR